MFDIQLNESGTRHMSVTATTLETIRRYNLFDSLPGASGYITEGDLDRLKMTLRSLIASNTEDTKALLDLCIDVIYHDKMKAFGLKNLVAVYKQWFNQQSEATDEQA